MTDSPQAVVIGALNIDLILQGLPYFAAPEEQVNGEAIRISAGGKGRNLAAMLAAWLPPRQVWMLGKLVVDRKGFYRIPLESLDAAGVETQAILLDDTRPNTLPTFAIFLNTTDGQRANYYFPGENETLTPQDLDRNLPLFERLAKNQGILLLTLEMPLETAAHALALAHLLGLRVMVDPGGQPPQAVVGPDPLLKFPIYLIKSNVQEAAWITGIIVSNFDTASQAAARLMGQGVERVVITHGDQGAYCFSDTEAFHVLPPERPIPAKGESTGCGDQVMAALCARLLAVAPFRDACHTAVKAGSLQYFQSGVSPIKPDNPQLSQLTITPL